MSSVELLHPYTVQSRVSGSAVHASGARLRRIRLLCTLLLLPLPGCATATADLALIDDAQTAARVKTALVNDPAVGAYTIEVRVARGVATLTGRVPTQEDVTRAVEIARGVFGVTSVRPNLQVGAVASPAALDDRPPPAAELNEPDAPPGLLALGASVAWSQPRSASLENRLAIGPVIKIGSAAGFGPAIGFDWYQAELDADGAAAETRIRVKPIMGGVGYTWRGTRVSVAPSIVAGYAFNSLSIHDTASGTTSVTAVAVDIGNSFAWRVGASAWFDLTRRVALNISAGRLMTGLRLTVLEDGRLDRRDASGDTTILRGGLAYRIF